MKRIYVIYDKPAKLYTLPIHIDTDRDAIHGLKTQVNKPDNQFHNYPQDFDLKCLGTFNEQTATYELFKAPEHIISALELKETK